MGFFDKFRKKHGHEEEKAAPETEKAVASSEDSAEPSASAGDSAQGEMTPEEEARIMNEAESDSTVDEELSKRGDAGEAEEASEEGASEEESAEAGSDGKDGEQAHSTEAVSGGDAGTEPAPSKEDGAVSGEESNGAEAEEKVTKIGSGSEENKSSESEEDSADAPASDENGQAEGQSASGEESDKVRRIGQDENGMIHIRISRYTMVAEQVLQFKSDEAVITGMLQGRVEKSYPVFVYFPGKPMAAAIVTRIETAPGVTGKFAENQHCSLTIHNPQGLRDIDKYSVISDIRTPSKLNPKIPIENPYLLGLTNVYEANMKDNAFMGLFIFALTHSVFVVPVAVDDGSVHEDAQGHKSANIRLHFIANKDHPENKTLPIFTDLASLVLWKGVVDPKNPPKTMVLRFQDAADIATRDFNGLALNAFGPKPLFISNKFIDKIRSLDAYVREFGKQGHASIKPVEEPAGHDGKVDDSLLKH